MKDVFCPVCGSRMNPQLIRFGSDVWKNIYVCPICHATKGLDEEMVYDNHTELGEMTISNRTDFVSDSKIIQFISKF